MLNAKNQKGLAAQAMHELGNLHYHAGNIRYYCRNGLVCLLICSLAENSLNFCMIDVVKLSMSTIKK